MSNSKRIKFHWGHGIIVFFIFYIGFLLTAVVKSRGIDHSLVAKDYYAQDIAYDQQYQKINNRNSLKQDLKIEYQANNHNIVLDFGNESKNLDGKIAFYRPSDISQDYTEKFLVETGGVIQFSSQLMQQGRWIVKVEWTDQEKTYYKEEVIFIQ